MKIYTKTGDLGETSLIDGLRVSKADDRLEAYGTLDELNSYLGWLIVKLKPQSDEIQLLQHIQNEIFVMSSHLAIEKMDPIYKIPNLSDTLVDEIENRIDEIQNILPKLTYFILPGGTETASLCHIARCVCRNAERNIVRIKDKIPENEKIIKTMNRLSDYLFVLARKVIAQEGETEIYWKP